MIEKEGTDDAEEARNAFYHSSREAIKDYDERLPADHVSSALIERVDAMLHKLEKELDDVDIKIGDRWRILDRDYDGKVTAEEVAAAAMFLKDSLDKESVHELISNLAKDPGKYPHNQYPVSLSMV
jgi:LETM1 and EF-hand domain-containing protein 1